MASRSMNKDAPEWRESMKRSAERTGVLLGGAAIIVLTLLLVIALLSYRPSDPSLMTAAEGPARNFVGAAGAWTADILLSFFGPAIGLIVPLLIVFGTRMLRGVPVGRWRRRTLGALGGIILIGA